IGVGIGALETIHDTSKVLVQKGARWVSPFFIPYVIANMAAGLTSTQFGLRGPNLCTTTACTSVTHGIGEAWLYIKNNMADAMVCGGS
ncbi:beta-ketoacyl synthase N-terminal-like domain-containing protein, partial [Streptococcus pneumoniae]|uniref:beta-ketoacyl synthase N-terminal-like domain-containing protein n=1 Tax=Streptococcus pneumoniae TaxID=1313 RepID=UPI0022A8EFC9